MCCLRRHSFKVIFELFFFFSERVFKMPCNFEYLTVERSRFKFGTCGLLAVHIWGSILGHSIHSIDIKKRLCKFTGVTHC